MMYILLVLQNVLTSGFSKCTFFWFCKMYLLLLYTILDCNMYLLLMYTILVFQNVHTSDVHNYVSPYFHLSSKNVGNITIKVLMAYIRHGYNRMWSFFQKSISYQSNSGTTYKPNIWSALTARKYHPKFQLVEKRNKFSTP